MRPDRSRFSRLYELRPWILLLALASGAGLGAAPASAQAQCGSPLPAPYLFILLHTSQGAAYAPTCSAQQFAAGFCSTLCPGGDCFVPLQGDDPRSTAVQLKAALFNSVRGASGLQLGFATANTDALRVRSKHWLYQAATDGPPLPGFGPFPARGAQEVFGRSWTCDEGRGDLETGCHPKSPADLSQPWDFTRMARLPKGGSGFKKTIRFYVKTAGVTERIEYVPAGTGQIGDPTLQVLVRFDRCLNTTCTLTSPGLLQTVTWQRVAPFLSWDDAGTTPNKTDPGLAYFTSVAADASATNSCSGWEPNDDDAADAYHGYDLHGPTAGADPRGPLFSVGDRIPLDWTNDHRQDILLRLAPNLALDPNLEPDFGVASYFRDRRAGGEDFLRLLDERARPLIPAGETSIAASLQSFEAWYAGWSQVAAAQDPGFACRQVYLLVVSDRVADTCNGALACSVAQELREQSGVKTFALGYGQSGLSDGGVLECVATNGGTGDAYLPASSFDLVRSLDEIFQQLLLIRGAAPAPGH